MILNKLIALIQELRYVIYSFYKTMKKGKKLILKKIKISKLENLTKLENLIEIKGGSLELTCQSAIDICSYQPDCTN